MSVSFDVVAIGNAIVDVICPTTDDFLAAEGLAKGSMALIDEARAHDLYGRMDAAIETSGGSAANTAAGLASLGAAAAYVGKVASDQLGEIFAHDMNAIGVAYDVPPLTNGPSTARCLIGVTPDGQRTMSTYLGAAGLLYAEDVVPSLIEASAIVYLEGYLFDSPSALQAFARAAALARSSNRLVALSLSDGFVADRHRDALLGFIQSQVDIVFANEVEATSLTQTDDFDTAVDRLAAITTIAAVTRGALGSVVASGASRHVIAPVQVDKVVDTTGAGDQYAAGFLFGLAKGRGLEICGALGSMAAAEAIGHYGPRPLVSLKELAAQNGLAD
ncbi:MAG: adenosine kinase [Caulobacteraceae bacterium]|nr:adenosine kinase [Caulobacteraceae bacterium]